MATRAGQSVGKPRAWSVVGEDDGELRIRSYRDSDDPDRVFVVVDSADVSQPRTAEPRSELRRQAHTSGTCPICSQEVPR